MIPTDIKTREFFFLLILIILHITQKGKNIDD